jgi:hypothetical protein
MYICGIFEWLDFLTNTYCNEETFPIIPTENSYLSLDCFPFTEVSKADIFMHVLFVAGVL